jgi:hypothetical protein
MSGMPSIPCQVGFSLAADLKHALDPAAQGGSARLSLFVSQRLPVLP